MVTMNTRNCSRFHRFVNVTQSTYSIGARAAVVEVDRETGTVAGQVHGGVAR